MYTPTAVRCTEWLRKEELKRSCKSQRALCLCHTLGANFLCPCRSRYRGAGTDLSKVATFKRHEEDCGSTEVQIARLSARVQQLTSHLKEHRRDYAATRGLVKILGQRRRLMTFIYRENRCMPATSNPATLPVHTHVYIYP